MAISSTSFKLTFRLDSAPKVIEVTDLEDYSLQGADNNNIVGNIVITGPDGELLYNNPAVSNPDITKSAGDNNQTPINLPLLADGRVEQGRYIVSYTATDTSDSSQAQVIKTFEFCYKSPKVEIEITADCIQPLLTSTDTSNYVVEGVTPSVVRDHKIHFPVAAGANPISATTQKLQTSAFFTNTQTSIITSTLTYDYGDDVCIIDVVTASQEVDVQCDTSVCDLYCCLYELYNDYKAAKGTNQVLAKDLKAKWLEAESIRSLIKDSYNCNKETNVADLINDVLKIGNCEPGCGCADGEPVAIIGLTTTTINPGSVTVVEAGDGITVSSEQDGDTTTYIVSLNASDKAKLDSLNANTEVVAGDGVNVESSTGAEGQTIYEVSADVESIGSGAYFIYRVRLNDKEAPDITLWRSKILDPNLGEPTIAVPNAGTGKTYRGNPFSINVALLGAGNTPYREYFPSTTIVSWIEEDRRTLDLIAVNNQRSLFPFISNVIIIDQGTTPANNDSFRISFTDSDGVLITGNSLADIYQSENLREFFIAINII